MSDFADRLRNLRQMRELSPQALAQVCGISYESQQAYEAGLVGPNARYLQALADAGLEVAYLTTGEFPSPRPEGMDRKTFAFLDNYRHCSPEAQAEIYLTLMISAAPNLARQEREAARVRFDQPRDAANEDDGNFKR
ncbi:helix-turn-helix transcriptional regulator [Acidovorax sp. BLS4]|uniref:helix-turn-helix domain-containing protein n=1 Tax=Acidovorax sp. BLS4 TaxID=3273430 RepID=UPI0029425A5E|nr:helix-turn-helix transcriptional regulator [Paracidovorax avenae]WOI46991.1 helix-turn-helix transcriptional regulator [Paracidovorax avenae]